MMTTAAKGRALRGGLLMAIVSLGGTCLAQSGAQEQQPATDAAQSAERTPASNAVDSPNVPEEFSESRLGLSLLKNIALDQEAIWTSPAHLRLEDANWILP